MNTFKHWGLSALFALTGLSTAAQGATYGFLAPGQIKLCPGVAPRVLKVEIINSIQSGGCCGRRFQWAEGRPIRLRDPFEGRLRAMDLSALSYGDAFTRAVNPALLYAEERGIADTRLSICISKFDIVNVVQHMEAPTLTTFDLGYRVFAITGPAENRVQRLVQELGGRFTIQSGFYFLFINRDLRMNDLVNNNWKLIAPQIDTLIKPTPNEEADRGLQFIHGLLSDFTDFNGGL